MTAAAGSLAIAVGLAASVAGIAALLAGRARDSARLTMIGRRATVMVFLAVTAAVVALESALIRLDFSILYVAGNLNAATPLLFRVIGLWGALEGSILLWAWFLAGFTALVAVRYRDRYPQTVPLALAILLGIGAFFLALMLGPADPFKRILPAPAEGLGLNPLLQNHPLMAVHPPFLYLGYVGISVPYAFAMAALLSRHLRDEWMMVTRRWTMAAWSFLTAGIVLGAWWSYAVLGWGGYWAWDPVENAAFLPWLATTAFLHSVIVQERRRLLRIWNHALVITAFLLTVFGTFLTRSGILASVHAFTVSLIGPLFLGFIGLSLGFSVFALVARREDLGGGGSLPAYLSRETLFILNNAVLLTIAAIIFIGTVFPLAAEAFGGAKVTVGPPYFNRLAAPLGLLLLVLMAAATLLPWGSLDAGAGRRFLWPVVATAAATALLAGIGVRGPTLAAFAIIGFSAAAQLTEFHRGARGLQRAEGGGYLRALAGLFRVNRRRYAGYLAHLGLALALAGITASSAYRIESTHILGRGDAVRVPGYLLRYDGATVHRGADRIVVAATIAVFRTPGAGPFGSARGAAEASPPGPAPADRTGTTGFGRMVAVLRPAEHLYPQQRTPVPTPAVYSTWRGDLYLVLLAIGADGTAVLKAIVNPLVTWIWTGGLLMAAAGLLSLWPVRRRRG